MMPRIIAVLIIVLWLLYSFIVVVGAEEHIHPNEVVSDHVGRFYEKWQRPDLRRSDGERYYGCCSRMDCFVPKIEYRGGELYVWHEKTDKWVHIPAALIERNYADGLNSPDAQNHACINSSGFPLCYVDAAGT